MADAETLVMVADFATSHLGASGSWPYHAPGANGLAVCKLISLSAGVAGGVAIEAARAAFRAVPGLRG